MIYDTPIASQTEEKYAKLDTRVSTRTRSGA